MLPVCALGWLNTGKVKQTQSRDCRRQSVPILFEFLKKNIQDSADFVACVKMSNVASRLQNTNPSDDRKPPQDYNM